MRATAESWVDFIDEHASIPETGRFREQLETFRGAFTQRWAINHGDLGLSNIFRLEGDSPRFAIIDFTDAEECDPSMEFSILGDDLVDEGLDGRQILGSVLRNYEINGDSLERKLEFRALLDQIRGLFRKVRGGCPAGEPCASPAQLRKPARLAFPPHTQSATKFNSMSSNTALLVVDAQVNMFW